MRKRFEMDIGLEIHVELATSTKIFCSCPAAFGGAVNTHTCPVCTGMPGALPVLNRQVVEYAMAVGLAANCEIQRLCRFDRKNYFYPDNPQNYQVSQLYQPICRNGWVMIETDTGQKKVRIHEIHMEEDAGKLVHDGAHDCSLVDFNRSGVPLIEIVSEPDMHSTKEVIDFLEKLRLMIQYLGVSDCKLQEGSMRVDVNLSVRESGEKKLGTRTEMKNLNSFRAIKRAVESEKMRQVELLERGERVIQETRRWDDGLGTSRSMRSKEDIQDYRYFPDPDLPDIVIADAWLEAVRERQPELQTQRLARFQSEFEIPEYDAEILTSSKQIADLFEQTTAICRKPKAVSNWLMVELMRLLRLHGMDVEKIRFSPENLAKLIQLVEDQTISRPVAKDVFEEIFEHNIDPVDYVNANRLKVVKDKEILRKLVEEAAAANPKSVEDYHKGKENAKGFLVGQTMRAMKGRADPGVVNQLVEELLER